MALCESLSTIVFGITCSSVALWATGDASSPPVPAPHPLITEVLYNVMPEGGDASQDGNVSPTGDEFVELYNPHSKSINLEGYRLTDRNLDGRGEFIFTFPKLILKPHQTVVVFNGYQQHIPGPVGTAEHSPASTNERFHNAYVFDAKAKAQTTAFANSGDWVLLWAPNGTPIQCVWWGKLNRTIPQNTLVIEHAPKTRKGSVQRKDLSSPFVVHTEINQKPYSPGLFTQPSKGR